MKVQVLLVIELGILFLPFTSPYERLYGSNIIIAAYQSAPYVFMNRQSNGNYTFRGTYVNMWNWLSVKVNFTFSYTILVDNDPLVAKLGVFEAAISKLITKEADAVIGALTVPPERKKIVDNTYFLSGPAESYTLVVPKPGQESRLFAFIRPFHFEVWLSLFIAMIACAAAMSLFSWLYENYPSNKLEENGNRKQEKLLLNIISNYAVYVVDTLTDHGKYSPYPQLSFRILAGCWLLATFVLVNSYSSLVVSSLTVPATKRAVDSFEDLLNSKEVFLILRSDIVLAQQILSAKDGTLKILADDIRLHPDRLFMDYDSVMKKLEDGQYAYPHIESFNRNFIVKQFRKDGVCRFQLSRPLPIMNPIYFFILQKNSRYTPAISIGLTYLWETGLSKLWVKQSISDRDECRSQRKKPQTNSGQKPIKLEDIFSAFLILGIGIGLALLSFVLEIISGVRRH